MSRARAIVAIPSGRRTKWAVLVFWLIVVALLGSLAGKLTGAEKNDASAWLPASAAATTLRSIARVGAAGLAVHIAGPLGNAADSANAFKGIDGVLLYATLAVVIVLLLITYRSPVLWLLPVISAGVALAAAQGLIYLLAKHGLTVNAQSAGILLVLVFGAGTDYALLLTEIGRAHV